mmetsp:Transcript_16610/g.29079  ORF Transcript_16610/g.29079 Transcript_16610/m.29079 type:complete len:86 (-) Transcript_16610:198-455(-)|eukprot:CAMPEP_0197643698 /NCGR_PEP_ID=MMETSP1338-20131121/16923_1 /TAXON_ID=43686 ORGANISM="Pelagodinium beii, Strain RCC1491" /NCGR_SAMPLE_ID=MMETSP1338 /ASSEMBLY_ACC=CAM_ASM_000754 /LENGTH=85 /DNA_ID=CAMNT_0043216979 /DNA_START=89 /DNA_END=346 /DNA_ORIENTATION=+
MNYLGMCCSSKVMEQIPGGSEALQKNKEESNKKIEEEIEEQAPAYLKPLFPCFGGPVGTIEKCMCLVPSDKKEQTEKAIASYREA